MATANCADLLLPRPCSFPSQQLFEVSASDEHLNTSSSRLNCAEMCANPYEDVTSVGVAATAHTHLANR